MNLGIGRSCTVGDAVLGQIVADQLANYLGRRNVLACAQLLKGLFLPRVDQNSKAGSFVFHDYDELTM